MMYDSSGGVRTAFELCQMSILAQAGSNLPEGQRTGRNKTSHGR